MQAQPAPPPGPPTVFNISPHISASYSAPLEPPPQDTIYLASGLVFSHSISGVAGPSPPRVLLLKRAPSARYPLDDKWDFPGGGVEHGHRDAGVGGGPGQADASIIHAAVRETWEETGLRVSRVAGFVGTNAWSWDPEPQSGARTERRIVKFVFLVEVEELHSPDRVVAGADVKSEVVAGGAGGETASLQAADRRPVAGAERWQSVEVKLMDEEHTEYVWATEAEVPDYVFIADEQMEVVLKGFAKWREMRERVD